ncbi:phage tail tape measure protein [Pseudomonas cichorii]|uniref:phage tail tape measure protein n=1 Tax=Pseudomonas cichorii TaxID=36746 RepID=UPI00191096AB|nr:phage tail tape measure protein [Pseudomonas cichorii]GFM86100.1 phage tail tape measure protein [Pseudomonas cichorii]
MADRSARLAFILSLTDKVSAPLNKVKTTFSDLAEQGENNIKQMGTGLAGLVGAGVAINESLQPALEMNRALGEVRSLGVAEDALESLNRKALEFSIAYGANAVEFAASAYSISGAIKGLAGDQLATFTNTSNLLAKATKSDAATMGAYVGTMYNLFKGQADAMGKGQWVEQLGGQTALAVQLFRTDGAQLKDAFKEVGAIATQAGVSVAEQMAVIGSLSSTMEGGDAGGRYKAFFENIGAASEKLGMKLTDSAGNTLPMLEILDKLEAKYGDLTSASAGSKLMEAFGGEGAQVLGSLAKDTDRLRNGIDALGKVRGLENADKMAKAMVDPWMQFSSAVQALRTSFGQALIPMLTPLMDKLVGIASTLTRWTQIFPNITRVIGATVLIILGLVAAMSAVTLVVGISKMAWLGMVTVWKLLNLQGLKSVAMFMLNALYITALVVVMTTLYTALVIGRTAMMLWQGAIWLANAALLANPALLIVAGIVALIAVVVAAVVYWDQWTGALMNTAAFQWIAGQLKGLSEWFGSIGGWTGMARSAWDGIVNIFKTAINGLIEMINKIPGVKIDAVFSDLPAPPEVPDLPGAKATLPVAPGIPDLPGASAPAQKAPLSLPLNEMLMPPGLPQAQEPRTSNVPSISPSKPLSVPRGGLMQSIQNTTMNQRPGTHVEKIEINTSKPMTPLELESMVAMSVGG